MFTSFWTLPTRDFDSSWCEDIVTIMSSVMMEQDQSSASWNRNENKRDWLTLVAAETFMPRIMRLMLILFQAFLFKLTSLLYMALCQQHMKFHTNNRKWKWKSLSPFNICNWHIANYVKKHFRTKAEYSANKSRCERLQLTSWTSCGAESVFENSWVESF